MTEKQLRMLVSGWIKSPLEETDYVIDPLLLDIEDNGQDIIYSDYMPTPNNQLTKGACVGCSGETLFRYLNFVETGKHGDFSEQWLYEKARIRGGYKEGATLKDAFYIMSHEGIPEDRFWPYTDNKKDIGEPLKGAEKNAMRYRIDDKLYFRLTSEKQIRTALIKYGPIHVAVYVYKNWLRHKNGHIPVATFCERMDRLGGHAIIIEDDLVSQNEYKFENSWGNWGEKEHGYLPKAEVKRSFAEGFAWVDLKNEPSGGLLTVAGVPKLAKLVVA